MPEQIIEIEAETTEQAREQIQNPKYQMVLRSQPKIISDGIRW